MNNSIYYLSFDVAYRSLAFYFAKVVDNKIFIPLFGDVVDFGEFNVVKTIKDITRFIKFLKYYVINYFNVKNAKKNLKIFIERQMNENVRASEIQSVLISCFVKYQVIIIDPLRKCSMMFFDDKMTSVDFWRKKCKKNYYRANKKCSAYTYKLIVNKCGFTKIILKEAKRISDLADAFMQMLTYLIDKLKTPLINNIDTLAYYF